MVGIKKRKTNIANNLNNKIKFDFINIYRSLQPVIGKNWYHTEHIFLTIRNYGKDSDLLLSPHNRVKP